MIAKAVLLTFAASASAGRVCIGAVTGLPDVGVWPNTPAPDVSVAVAVGADRWESEHNAHEEVYVCETETVQDSNSYTFDKCCEVAAPAGSVYRDRLRPRHPRHGGDGPRARGHAGPAWSRSGPEHPEWTDLGAVTITIGAAAPAAALAAEGSARSRRPPRGGRHRGARVRRARRRGPRGRPRDGGRSRPRSRRRRPTSRRRRCLALERGAGSRRRRTAYRIDVCEQPRTYKVPTTENVRATAPTL